VGIVAGKLVCVVLVWLEALDWGTDSAFLCAERVYQGSPSQTRRSLVQVPLDSRIWFVASSRVFLQGCHANKKVGDFDDVLVRDTTISAVTLFRHSLYNTL